jgi:hypothetical protein
VISEQSTGFPGYNSIIAKDKATIGRILPSRSTSPQAQRSCSMLWQSGLTRAPWGQEAGGTIHESPRSRNGSTARHEQQVGGAIHELRACGKRLFETHEFIGKLTIASGACRVPPRVRHESTVKQVETSQIFDVETAAEIAPQFGRRKQVKAERITTAAAELDFAPVSIGGPSQSSLRKPLECCQSNAPWL